MACSRVGSFEGSLKDAKALKNAHTNSLNRHTRVLNRANTFGTAIGTQKKIAIAHARCREPGTIHSFSTDQRDVSRYNRGSVEVITERQGVLAVERLRKTTRKRRG
jgi:hypothetical protein